MNIYNYILILFILSISQSLKIITCKPGGLYGFYMLGVSKYIKENYDLKDVVYYGASAGAWNSLYLSLKSDGNDFIKDIENIDVSNLENMFSIENIIKKNILKNYDENDFELHKINICVGVFKKYKIKKTIFSNFNDLEDIINCCIASSHIPYVTNNNLFTSYKNQLCIDGGFFGEPLPDELNSDLVLSPEIWNTTNVNYLSKIKTLDIKKLIKSGYEDSHKNRHELDLRLI